MLQDRPMNSSFDEWFILISFIIIFIRGLMELGENVNE